MPPKKKLEFDPSPGAPFAAEPGQEFPAGLSVVRGPGWSFGDQDGGEADAIGLVDGWSAKNPGNARVRWPNGKVCSYPPDGKTLVVAPEEAVARNAERDELRKGPRAPKLRNGESLLGLVFVPGPDWRGASIPAKAMLVPCAWVGSDARIEVRVPDGTKTTVRVGYEGRYDVLLPTDEQYAAWKEECAAALKALETKFFRWIRSGSIWTRCFSWFARPGPMRIPLAQARMGIDASLPEWRVPEDGDFENIQRLLAARFTELCASEADVDSASAGDLLARVVSKNPGNQTWANFLSGKNSGECDARVPAIGESRPPARAAAGAATVPFEATLVLRRVVHETVRVRVSGNLPLDLVRLRYAWENGGFDDLYDALRGDVALMVNNGAYVRRDGTLERLPGTERITEEVREDWSVEAIGGDGEDLGGFAGALASRFEDEGGTHDDADDE